MKFKSLVLFTAAVAVLASCTKKEEPVAPAVEDIAVSLQAHTFQFPGNETILDTVITEAAWTVEGLTPGVKQWIELDATSGTGTKAVQIKCIESNPRTTLRTAMLTFKTSNREARVILKQYPDPERTVISSEDSLNFGAAPGQELTTEIITNKTWSVEGFTPELQDWLSIAPQTHDSTGTVTFKTLKMNEEPGTRYATVGFRIDRVNCAEVVVSQPSGIVLTTDSDSLKFGFAAGQKITLGISSNAQTKNWEIKGYTADVQEWLTISSTTGLGDASVDFTTKTQNDDAVRYASLVVAIDSVHFVPLVIKQASSLEIHTDLASMEFDDSLVETKPLVVTTTTTKYAWHVKGYTEEVQSWLTLSDTTFTGLTKTVNISTLGENRTNKDREVTLRFYISETIFTDVTVKQPMIPLKTKVLSWAGAKTCTIWAPPGASYGGFPYANNSSTGSVTSVTDGVNGTTTIATSKAFPNDYSNVYVFGSSATEGFSMEVGTVKGSFFMHMKGYTSIRIAKTYLELPAFPGYKLTNVYVTSANASSSASISVTSDKAGTKAVDGYSKVNYGKQDPLNAQLKSTAENTSYYIYMVADRQMDSFKLTYTEVRK